jgi:type III secretory pathway component EscS
MLVTMEYQTIKAFILLRSGMLPDDMVSHVVGEIVHTKQKARVVQEKVLSEVIKLYVEAKESG